MSVNTTQNGPIGAEGKTKVLWKIPGTTQVLVRSKRDITAGDGATRDEFEKKDVYATTTTCRVFELLRACGIPVSYLRQESETDFIAEWTDMIPLEVVARRVIGTKSSYRKRNPHVEPGTVLPTLVVEFFLKTTGKRFGEYVFEKDDPLITSYHLDSVVVRRPDVPTWIEDTNPVHTLPGSDVYARGGIAFFPFKKIEELVRRVFLVLEGAWATQSKQLCDLKIEVGYTSEGLVVSDVIDADSWRLVDRDGNSLDKQPFRDSVAIGEVANIYERVASLVGRFEELHERPNIVLWCASEKDDPKPFREELGRFGFPANLHLAYGSVHKKPEQCLKSMRRLVSARPSDTAVIVYVGRSNGAGPVFACDTHVPVIAVSSSIGRCPEDIWSSVNVPSDCPLMFQKYPENAIQAALGILSARSPHAYMVRRTIVEDAHLNATNSPSFGKTW